MAKEEFKLFKEIKRVEPLSTSDNFTSGKIYDVYGVYLEKFSDRSQGLRFLLKDDRGVLVAEHISNFKIVD